VRRRHQLLAYPPVDPLAQHIGVALVPGVLLLMPAIISGPHAIRHRFWHRDHPRSILTSC